MDSGPTATAGAATAVPTSPMARATADAAPITLVFLILSPFDVHGVPPIETVGGGPVRPVDATRRQVVPRVAGSRESTDARVTAGGAVENFPLRFGAVVQHPLLDR
ncbi:hypothetical protein GCM10010932_14160 [Agromyces flavus]|nr:hypothetical protein GCM10010932_14160 [Agromyces flavus]